MAPARMETNLERMISSVWSGWPKKEESVIMDKSTIENAINYHYPVYLIGVLSPG